MTVKEVYEQFQGNYESVLSRLRDDERIKKYLLKLVDYHYDDLIKNALKEQDYETAFRESHNLKGICANLSIDALEKTSSDLTEALRGRNPEGDITPLVDALQRDMDITMAAIKELM